MMQPVAHAALVAQRHAEDVFPRLLARDVTAFLADDEDKFALVVELFGIRGFSIGWPDPTTEEGLRTNRLGYFGRSELSLYSALRSL